MFFEPKHTEHNFVGRAPTVLEFFLVTEIARATYATEYTPKSLTDVFVL